MMNRPGKQSMSELKLRRLTEHNLRLKEDLDRPRIRVSEAAQSCVLCSAIVVSVCADCDPRFDRLLLE